MWHLNWGPYITHNELDLSICDELKRRGDINRENKAHANKDLAGHFKEHTEYRYTKSDVEWFVDNTQSIWQEYFEGRQKYHDFTIGGDIKIELYPMWINYMKAGDFNPIHTHTGDYSFVIFLNIPEELNRENEIAREETNDKYAGPGSLSFFYGNIDESAITANTRFPKKGDMYIFPANVRHMVYPFKSNVERISVSGNVKKI